MADLPALLIELERAAEAERAKLDGLTGEEYAAQWRVWRDAAATFQAAVADHPVEGMTRHELEQAAKKAVRYTE
ncbi:hypothetical protein ABTZ78_17185 [Streptomyces bauhiniae]|uniref:hypothetical protein n=1 Tax=Streptomyces bauhiniae TaxID=2340725 RepID=UPI00332CC075